MSYPFDLERALKGEAVVTRDGNAVTQIGVVKDAVAMVTGYIGITEYSWFDDGLYYGKWNPCKIDLFMLNPAPDADNS